MANSRLAAAGTTWKTKGGWYHPPFFQDASGGLNHADRRPTRKTTPSPAQFTDTSGQEWREGDNFTGDEKAIQNALRNGNIKEEASQQRHKASRAARAKPQGQPRPTASARRSQPKR